MSDIGGQVREAAVPFGSISVTWLGQAGFIFKTSDGVVIMLDPYLSDSVERLFGFKRLMPKLLRPNELIPEILLCTHHHEDHLDADAVPALMSGGSTKLVCSRTAGGLAEEMGVDPRMIFRMGRGEMLTVGGVTIHSTFADHGNLAPDALGFYLEVPGISVYMSGDTGYAPKTILPTLPGKPDVFIAPINGAYGNLDAIAAAKLANDVVAQSVIPCHFWMFAEHGGDPAAFARAMKEHAPNASLKMMCQGETILLSKDAATFERNQ